MISLCQGKRRKPWSARGERAFDGAQRDLVACTEARINEAPLDEEEIEDDRLRLIFTCCHPAPHPGGQVALIHLSSPGNEHEKRPYWARHLRSKLAEQISGCSESELQCGSLSRMSNIVEAGRKVGIAHKSAGSGSYEVRYCRQRMSGVGSIHDREADGMDAP